MTYLELYSYAKSRLTEYEAMCIMEDIFEFDRSKLAIHGNEIPENKKDFLTAVEKRAKGIPLQYATGKAYFMGREYFVGEGVLIPRDDTEVAVNECIEFMTGNERVIDLCSGSGIIAVTLAKEFPKAEIYAVELENKAFAYLEKNVKYHHADVKLVHDSIFNENCVEGEFDIIISNPPYICTDIIPDLQSEVQYEPKTALDGGNDGLDFYRCIAEKWVKKLRKGGKIILEIGEEQAKSVGELLKVQEITQISVVKDIQNLDRVVFGTVRK